MYRKFAVCLPIFLTIFNLRVVIIYRYADFMQPNIRGKAMRYLFNKGWRFLETKVGTSFDDAMTKESEFKPVQVPHDWLIYDSTDLYRDGTGWYIRELEIKEMSGRYFLEFDAVYMDSAVYVNGEKVFEWKYGYSAFDCEITEYVHGGTNRIAVSATYQSPNTRWYSGAGIYRNVYIRQTGGTYIARDGVYVSNRLEEGKRILHIETEVLGDNATCAVLTYTVTDPSGKAVELIKMSESDYEIVNPHIWDINDTYLYTLKAEMKAGTDADFDVVRFGIRDSKFDPNKGFFLNGRHMKLNGVCEHHDLGALGAAFNKCAMRRKLEILKKMGANALRTSHNMPAPEVLDLCDEMGFLVMSENFDMWYRPKTEFDYARFFADWHERDMTSWVKQDRNHPSVIMWSIGNEIYDVHADASAPDTVRHLMDVVYKYDPYKNALCTFASNFMPWEGGQKCADILKLVGYNYSENIYKEHHEKHPDWMIYGSETGSLVQSRGVYKFPLSETRLTDVDEQCSALGNCNTSWGARSIEDMICEDRDMEFSAGQFIWTGFDYIGEPTPYHTKNSYFGLLDTAGFPKDFYYVVKSQWTDPVEDPFVHSFPTWDLNPGQTIDFRVVTNGSGGDVYSGECQENFDYTYHIDHNPGGGKDNLISTEECRFGYYPRTVTACGNVEGTTIAKEELLPFGDSSSICITCDKEEMRACSDDIIFAEINTLDEEGAEVKNACDRVFVEVTGAGRLVGLDNGDSTDLDSYKGTSRRLFNGKLLAMIAPGSEDGDVTLKVTAKGLISCEVTLKCTDGAVDHTDGGRICYPSPFDAGISDYLEQNINRPILLGKEDDIPVRKIEITREAAEAGSNSNDSVFNADCLEKKVNIRILPENATDRELTWDIVSEKGVPTNIAEVTPVEGGAILRAKGDGKFYLRCMSKSGSDKIRVISEMDYRIEGVGKAFLDPYELIYGSSYSYSEGDIGAGNEMGFATSKTDRSLVGFENVDFGSAGSDEITIPVFALDSDPHRFRIYDGIPSKGGVLIGDFVYHKPSIWNVYQEDTWTVKEKLKGVHTLCFEFEDKVHIKGFVFKKYDKAFSKLDASSADDIYGDDFKTEGKAVCGIGNNVSITFKEMDFGEEGTSKICIKGRAPKGDNTIHVRFADSEGETRNVIEFAQCDTFTEREFEFDIIKGMKNVSLVFMPGSYFDLESLEFKK